jgi:endonuclease/exonuclease/phosphatase family metal-dependent hydrolase
MLKKTTLLLLLFFTALQFVSGRNEKRGNSEIKMATYNIRLQTPADSLQRSWTLRKNQIAKLIKKYDFDIFNVQEVGNPHQEADLKKLLPEYTYYGKGRDNQNGTSGEQIGIFYRTDRFTIRDYGYFFLSSTPEQLSIGWDAAFRRMCVWTKLLDKNTDKTFYVFCTHFDHIGVTARVESAKLIVNKINQITGDEPVLFAGDLNTSPESTEMYKIISSVLNDSREITEKTPKGSVGTFNNFDVTKSTFPLAERIDYIFSKKFSVKTYQVLNDQYSTRTYPSDHFPVLIRCHITDK